MITVKIEQPDFQKSENLQKSETSSYSSFDQYIETDKKKKHKNKRYHKVQERLKKLENSRNEKTRKELKIRERNISESIILPKQLNNKPMKNVNGYLKLKKHKDYIRDSAINQLRKSKQMHSINLIDDGIKLIEGHLKGDLKIDQKTEAINPRK